MGRTTFDKPVILHLPEPQGGSVQTEVHNTREAIAAITQHGWGDYNLDRGVWAMTLSLVTRAALDPTPQNLRMAQLALEVLASQMATRH